MRGLRFGALFALVAAVGLVGATGSFAASTTGVTTSTAAESNPTSTAPASDERCGPCPTFVFGKGSGAGTIVVTTHSTGESQRCVIPQTGNRDCDFTLDEFSSSTLQPEPASGSKFSRWEGCPEGGQVGSACVLPANTPAVLCATFQLLADQSAEPTSCPPPALLLYKSGDGTGSVTGPVSCDANCRIVSRRFPQGTQVTLNAQANPGSRFVRWDGTPCASATGSTCSFPLDTVAEVCAVFVKDGSTAPDDRSCPPRVTPPLPGRSTAPPPLGSRCTIRGSRGADVISGSRGNDVLCGLGGNDVVYGKGGNDLLVGGGGNDRLYGQAGNDRIVGGSGKDRLYGAAGADILHARDRARDLVNGGLGSDRARVNRGDTVRSIERRF